MSQRGPIAQQLIAVTWLVAALGAVAAERYATQDVGGSECVIAYSRMTVGTEFSDTWTPDEETIDRAYQKAVETGRCERPRKRWEEWLD
ncbi:hypothetical protein OYE22_12685 [Streptomyces sp. 71268]|uniref:hypothetical protein n=1 Tax=Streptomyces sp. 71268 TaxID=3002640 RepID=UPI0023F976A2|nr:hypothetical protein [Streptomyces sp. 71268]WEV25958.1 hypothetical protein OYE22_12685 [Streptomyces sp. 71268]